MFKLGKFWLAFVCSIADFLGMNWFLILKTSSYWSHFSLLRLEQGMLISSVGRSLHPSTCQLLCEFSISMELMFIRLTKESKTGALRSSSTWESVTTNSHLENYLFLPVLLLDSIFSSWYEFRKVGLTRVGFANIPLGSEVWLTLRPGCGKSLLGMVWKNVAVHIASILFFNVGKIG